MAADPEDESLAALLRSTEATCPACGHGLYGITSTACPECGRGLTVRLATNPEQATVSARSVLWCVLLIGPLVVLDQSYSAYELSTFTLYVSGTQQQIGFAETLLDSWTNPFTALHVAGAMLVSVVAAYGLTVLRRPVQLQSDVVLVRRIVLIALCGQIGVILYGVFV
jgi:hypothetical protein